MSLFPNLYEKNESYFRWTVLCVSPQELPKSAIISSATPIGWLWCTSKEPCGSVRFTEEQLKSSDALQDNQLHLQQGRSGKINQLLCSVNWILCCSCLLPCGLFLACKGPTIHTTDCPWNRIHLVFFHACIHDTACLCTCVLSIYIFLPKPTCKNVESEKIYPADYTFTGEECSTVSVLHCRLSLLMRQIKWSHLQEETNAGRWLIARADEIPFSVWGCRENYSGWAIRKVAC